MESSEEEVLINLDKSCRDKLIAIMDLFFWTSGLVKAPVLNDELLAVPWKQKGYGISVLYCD